MLRIRYVVWVRSMAKTLYYRGTDGQNPPRPTSPTLRRVFARHHVGPSGDTPEPLDYTCIRWYRMREEFLAVWRATPAAGLAPTETLSGDRNLFGWRCVFYGESGKRVGSKRRQIPA